jgi:hypothetical protein
VDDYCVRAAAAKRESRTISRAPPLARNATAAHTMSDNLIFPYGCMTNCLRACCFFACLGSKLPRFRFVSFEYAPTSILYIPALKPVIHISHAPKYTNAHSKAWQLDGLLGAKTNIFDYLYSLSMGKQLESLHTN